MSRISDDANPFALWTPGFNGDDFSFHQKALAHGATIFFHQVKIFKSMGYFYGSIVCLMVSHQMVILF